MVRELLLSALIGAALAILIGTTIVVSPIDYVSGV